MKILESIKKEKWFKMGKWKEPGVMQDMVVRSVAKKRDDIILPFRPGMYAMSEFNQCVPLKDFKKNVEEAKKIIPLDIEKIDSGIRKEVATAIKKMENFKMDRLDAKKARQYFDMVENHLRQSYRFMIMGYALLDLYLPTLPEKFKIKNKIFTPQTLLAKVALPKKAFPMIREHSDLLKISMAFKDGKNISRRLEGHAGKYSWMNSLCWWDEPFSASHYLEEVKRLSHRNPGKELEKIVRYRKEQYAQAEVLLKEVKKNYPKAWQYIDMIRNMTDGREASWDVVSMAGVRFRPHFKALAAKHGLTYNQLMSLSVKEMLSLLEKKSKPDVHTLNSILQGVAVVARGSSTYTFTGNQARQITKWLEGETPKMSVIKGMPIWSGKTSGRVRAMFSVADVSTMRDGEILVCPMTDPDYMPAIRKAKALVTDQGGVLCHAAIVARELQKICIVGTQIATRLIKTGDKIEVDANKGIVKLLK